MSSGVAASLTARSMPPQQGTVMRVSVMDLMPLPVKSWLSFAA